ncbi:MAG TPA: aspartyl protease family protein [Pyrinomonadaceae bacterium]|nr:aspartyl protease family protein [Pyrinomonadaceae bacterium]
MKLATRIQFPFQSKRVLRFTWISIILLCLSLIGWANDEVRQPDVKNPKELIKQAEKFVRKGNLLDAEKILVDIIDKDSTNAKAKLVLSHIYLKQRKLIESYNLAFDVAKNDPKSARALALIGMVLLNNGNFKDSLAVLNRAWTLDNQEPLAWYGYGMLSFYENRIEEGLVGLERAEYFSSDDCDIIFSLAQVLARAEKYKEAADEYNKFLSVSPKSDLERRARIKGLIDFLRYLGNKQELYKVDSNTKRTIVPIELLRDRPIIEVKVNGKEDKLRFVLDTGSGISVISQETAQKMKIKPISKGGTARAVGGDGKFEIVYGFLNTVSIGDSRVRNVPVYIRKFHDDGERVDGYIGLSLISKFLTTVDYGTSTFTLTKKNNESVASFEKESIALPLRLTSSGFLSGEVQLSGMEIPLNFIVDTGASISVISSDIANTKEMSQFSIAEKMRVVGAAGVTENVSSYILPKVTFGTHTRESVKAIALDLDVINEASGFEQAGILGGNFLKNYRLTFDFQNSKVTFVPVKK